MENNNTLYHPIEEFLRMDRIPHIWCSGCGLGTNLTAFIEAAKKTKINFDKLAVVSGIGCTGRVAGYVKFDSFHTTHGRAIPFATGLKLANRDLTVAVFSGDGDLFAIGGNHLIHAARRNIDLTVICVNNFIYGMTGGQTAPTTPLGEYSSTAPYGNFEEPFNLVGVAASAGATFVARWTTLHMKRLTWSIEKALKNKGFSFIEIISPCPTVYARKNKKGIGLDLLHSFADRSRIEHDADPTKIPIEKDQPIICGEFINKEKPSFWDNYQHGLKMLETKQGK